MPAPVPFITHWTDCTEPLETAERTSDSVTPKQWQRTFSFVRDIATLLQALTDWKNANAQRVEEANLIVSEKDGRLRKLYINAVPIQMLHERWTTEYSALWAGKLTAFKYKLEEASN